MDIAFKAQGGAVIRDIARPDARLVEELGRVPTSILSDCLDRFGALRGLTAVGPSRAFAGTAFTVEEIEAGNLMSHLALKYVQPGDVLVLDGKGVTTRAGWGGLQTFAALKKGVAAVLVDGAVRDVDDIHRYGLPVYCRAVSPAGPHKGWGGHVNRPVQCGGAVVQPGDVIVGDADGLVVVPRGRAAAVLEKARARMKVEQEWFRRVEQGEDTVDFLGFMAQVRALGIEIR
jgi:regulator of RNase E activity RraA